MNDKVNIHIRVADLSPMPLQVERSQEIYARQAEATLNQLWAKWKRTFPDRTPEELLGMVAFRITQVYYETLGRQNEMLELLRQLDRELEQLLPPTESDSAPPASTPEA